MIIVKNKQISHFYFDFDQIQYEIRKTILCISWRIGGLLLSVKKILTNIKIYYRICLSEVP